MGLSASDSATINTTDTRDRQHDDDFEKGLDCGDHLFVLDPPLDGAAGCLRVWRVQRRVGRRLIFQPLDHQWARLLPYCRERWLCKAVIRADNHREKVSRPEERKSPRCPSRF